MSPGGKDAQVELASARTPTDVPKLLSFAAHELRSPLTVVSGYLRMLLKEGAGPLQDQQRRLLEDMEKSCGRLSALLAEMTELSQLEAGTSRFNRGSVDVRRLLAEAAADLPPMTDRRIDIDVTGEVVRVNGDAVRLKRAFASILFALRRELVTSDRIAVRVQHSATHDGSGTATINIAEEAKIDRLVNATSADIAVFKERRGGTGLSLAIARRIIEAHGGRIWGIRAAAADDDDNDHDNDRDDKVAPAASIEIPSFES